MSLSKAKVDDSILTKLSINWDFIDKLEGKLILKGYVPNRNGVPLGKSGVTIATGFDLGQRKTADLHYLGLPEDLITKLAKYTYIKRDQAMKMLEVAPLEITKEEAKIIDNLVKKDITKKLYYYWNEDVQKRKFKDNTPKFENLKPDHQTVLASLAFQYGPGFRHRDATRALWGNAQRGLWMTVRDQLLRLAKKTPYRTRRTLEAKLIHNKGGRNNIASKSKKKYEYKKLKDKPLASRRRKLDGTWEEFTHDYS